MGSTICTCIPGKGWAQHSPFPLTSFCMMSDSQDGYCPQLLSLYNISFVNEMYPLKLCLPCPSPQGYKTFIWLGLHGTYLLPHLLELHIPGSRSQTLAQIKLFIFKAICWIFQGQIVHCEVVKLVSEWILARCFLKSRPDCKMLATTYNVHYLYSPCFYTHTHPARPQARPHCMAVHK